MLLETIHFKSNKTSEDIIRLRTTVEYSINRKKDLKCIQEDYWSCSLEIHM